VRVEYVWRRVRPVIH